MLTVHHLETSRSQRVLWLLEELGVPYEIVKYQRDPKTMLAPDSLKKIHPLGKSPVITDGGDTIAESGAILEYLVEKYGKGGWAAPAHGTPQFTDYRYFLHYAEGSLMPILLVKLIANKIATGAPFLVRPIAKAISGKLDGTFVKPNLARHIPFLSDHLKKHKWFAGTDHPTAADIQMSYPMEAAASRGGSSPEIDEWVKRIRARPAYQRALEKGGPVIPD